MYRIAIPENVQAVEPLTGEPLALNGAAIPHFTWKQWCLTCVLNDRRVGSTPVQLARLTRLVPKVSKAVVGRQLDIEDDDYELLKPIVENPDVQALASMGSAFAAPLVMAQLLEFPQAFLRAQKVNDMKAKAEKK